MSPTLSRQAHQQFGTEITVAKLFEYVNTFDKNFYKNPGAVGRKERLAEIKDAVVAGHTIVSGGRAAGSLHYEDNLKAETGSPHREDKTMAIDEGGGKPPPLVLPTKAGHSKNVFHYLCKERGIDYEVVKYMAHKGQLYQALALRAREKWDDIQFLSLSEYAVP